MRVIHCDECETLIDVDDDTECFGGNDDVVCVWCRRIGGMTIDEIAAAFTDAK